VESEPEETPVEFIAEPREEKSTEKYLDPTLVVELDDEGNAPWERDELSLDVDESSGGDLMGSDSAVGDPSGDQADDVDDDLDFSLDFLAEEKAAEEISETPSEPVAKAPESDVPEEELTFDLDFLSEDESEQKADADNYSETDVADAQGAMNSTAVNDDIDDDIDDDLDIDLDFLKEDETEAEPFESAEPKEEQPDELLNFLDEEDPEEELDLEKTLGESGTESDKTLAETLEADEGEPEFKLDLPEPEDEAEDIDAGEPEFKLDLPAEEPEEEEPVEAEESGLPEGFEELPASEEDADIDETELDLPDLTDLDTDFELPEIQAVPVTAAAAPELDDLDLDMDLDLETPPRGDVKAISEISDPEIDLDPSDFELDLMVGDDKKNKSDQKTPVATAEAMDGQKDSPPTDGDDLDIALDFEDEPEAEPISPDEGETVAELDDDDDLVLDLDFEENGTDAEATEAPDKGSSEEPTALEDEESELEDFDLDELEAIIDEDDAAGGTDEDMELELDFEDISEEISDEATAVEEPDDDDFDLSDIEEILEKGETGEDDTDDDGDDDDEELDLDLDQDEDLLGLAGDEPEKTETELDEEEFDLSELEDVLDTDDSSEDIDDDIDLDLDLDAETIAAAEEEIADDAADLDLDIDELDLEGNGEDFVEETFGEDEALHSATEKIDAGEMELEFEVEDEPDHADLSATVVESEPAAFKDMPISEQIDAQAPLNVRKSKGGSRKKGTSKFLIFLLILALLGGLGYGTWYMVNNMGIEIPYLDRIPYIDKYFKPKIEDPGNLQLSTFDINSKFIENKNAGKLFVITGNIQNAYKQVRGFIQISGKLFTTGKILAQTRTVYAGNVLSDIDLGNLELDVIDKRLVTRFGDANANLKVPAGQSIPFMIVFSNLPTEELEEFTIEVVKSTPF
ncbi:MAG: DUF3426 domain-containing protein, partial [Desulfobacteraceae bacterium]|nr:DUF3426 domain-containing protein [Desulfobacteraceae bacterium]